MQHTQNSYLEQMADKKQGCLQNIVYIYLVNFYSFTYSLNCQFTTQKKVEMHNKNLLLSSEYVRVVL
jgi:hypothetical protein